MDLSRISPDINGLFPFLDLFAQVESETQSSVSLTIGRFTNRPIDCPPDADWFFDGCGPADFFQELGWIDFHYPCKGNRKILMRMNLPSEYHEPDRLPVVIKALLDLFSIPPDTVYVAHYFTVNVGFCEIPNDELGMG